MMKYAPLRALLLVLMLSSLSKAQTKTDPPTHAINVQTKELVTSQGPSKSVRIIQQDRKGNMWLASNEGIIRYDGQSFTNITPDLSADRFFAIVEDRKGNFWFGTYGSGAYYYDGQSFRHVTTQQGLANNQVSTLYEDKTGHVWFGMNGAVSRYDGQSFQNFITQGGGQTNDVNAILEDKTGKLWVGTRGYTYVYDGKTFAVFSPEGTSLEGIWSIVEDRKGTIWLGGHNGLWRYDGSLFTHFTHQPVRYVYEDKAGNIWTSGLSDGGESGDPGSRFSLLRYEEKSLSADKPVVREIAQSQNLFGILEDTDGRIWFGAYDGVYRYDGHTITDFKR